jgi:hypothetical protein
MDGVFQAVRCIDQAACCGRSPEPPPARHPPALPAAAAARRLRQATETLTGLEIDKSYLAAAITPKAQAVSSTSGTGIAHDKSTTQAVASDHFQRTLTRVATKSSFHAGGDAEAGIAAFGPVALSSTDTTAAVAASLSKAMPLAMDAEDRGASRGNTLEVFEPQTAKGLGATGLVATASVGVTDRPSNAFSMSDIGDGPHAVAHAGEATASAWAGRNPEKFKLLPTLPRDARKPGGGSGGGGGGGGGGGDKEEDGSAGAGGDGDDGDDAGDEPTAVDLEDVADASNH